LIAAMLDATNKPTGARRIKWINVSTVLSAAILIAAEVFGAAFAGGWALYNILLSPVFEWVGLDAYGVHITQGALFIGGIVVMAAFIRNAVRIEPFTTSG
jgi:hypothetical protein